MSGAGGVGRGGATRRGASSSAADADAAADFPRPAAASAKDTGGPRRFVLFIGRGVLRALNPGGERLSRARAFSRVGGEGPRGSGAASAPAGRVAAEFVFASASSSTRLGVPSPAESRATCSFDSVGTTVFPPPDDPDAWAKNEPHIGLTASEGALSPSLAADSAFLTRRRPRRRLLFFFVLLFFAFFAPEAFDPASRSRWSSVTPSASSSSSLAFSLSAVLRSASPSRPRRRRRRRRRPSAPPRVSREGVRTSAEQRLDALRRVVFRSVVHRRAAVLVRRGRVWGWRRAKQELHDVPRSARGGERESGGAPAVDARNARAGVQKERRDRDASLRAREHQGGVVVRVPRVHRA